MMKITSSFLISFILFLLSSCTIYTSSFSSSSSKSATAMRRKRRRINSQFEQSFETIENGKDINYEEQVRDSNYVLISSIDRNHNKDSHADSSSSISSDRRLSFFTSFYQIVTGHSCPPGPLGKKCHKDSGSSGSGSSGSSSSGSSSSGSSSSGSSSSSSGSSGSSSYVSSATSNSSGGSSSDGAGNSSSGSSGGSSSSSTVSGAQRQSSLFNNGAAQTGVLAIAALAMSVGIGAMYMGSMRRGRNNSNNNDHALKGALKKRIGIFSRMANRSSCSSCRPESLSNAVVDDGLSSVSDNTSPNTDYRLA